jgi:hypothetical protein
MVNIRIKGLSVRTSTSIEVTFTHNLDKSIAVENISITGAAGGIRDLDVLSVSVSNNILTITVRPMVPRANYKFTLASTDTSVVSGLKGERFIEDGATNVIYFIGQVEDSSVRSEILSDLPPIYNTDGGTLIFDSIDTGAREIEKASHILGEVRSSNYVSLEVTDEETVRGSGPFDRFVNEGVFKILRVGKTPSGTTSDGSIFFDSFPTDPVSLKQVMVSQELISNSVDDANKFEQLLVTVSQSPIIKLLSLKLVRGSNSYVYDIEKYRYGLLESKYDTDNSYPALDITNNQIKLSSSAIGPSFPLPQGSDEIVASYLYAKTGRDINSGSVKITESISVIREGIPSVATTFFLKNAPIINDLGNIPTTGGVKWLDPSANFDPSVKHSSFITEIPFSNVRFPSSIGQFSVNYTTGQVFVFGSDGTGVDGTTIIPPAANYSYQKTFQDGLDYIFYSDLDEVASIPNRDLRGNSATIRFSYEDTFAEGTDFLFSSHIEVINERVENRLIETIGIRTLNYPVTEVFRIYNETTGEIYTPSRIVRNEVYFDGLNPPVLIDISRESAEFAREVQAQIVVTDEIVIPSKSFVAFRVELSQTDIVSGTGDYVGASFNSSLVFSDESVFVREFYFDTEESLENNLVRLQQVGDFMVNYISGVAYVAAISGSSAAIGDATFRYGKIQTRHAHIVRADNIYRSISSTLPNVKIFDVLEVSDKLVSPKNLESVGETQINNSPILVESGTPNTITVSQDISRLRAIYQVTDLKTQPNPINFSEGAIVSSSNKNLISLGSATVTDETGLQVYQSGIRKYVTADRINNLYVSGIGQIVSAINVFGVSGANYFTQGSDGYVDIINNRIWLPTSTDALTGESVSAIYKAQLNGGAAVLVDYTPGDIFLDYTYCRDELLINYEYGDNVLDWSISNALDAGSTYFTTYRYGALRTALRDNFGVLTSIEEISNIPEDLDRETYRNAVKGSLQTFSKGPTIPAVEQLVEAFTQITPQITESVFLEWILGRDHLDLKAVETTVGVSNDPPAFEPGKFGDGLFLSSPGQIAKIPATSNFRVNEGTWEAFVVPQWDGIDNDAELTFNLLINGSVDKNKVFIGSNNTNPESIPFLLNRTEDYVLGIPSKLHNDTGYFVWYDSTNKKWRVRSRSLVTDSNLYSGTITTTGDMYDVRFAISADGNGGYDGYEITEVNDSLRSTDKNIKFAFIVDAYDSLNMAFDAYDSYSGNYYGFDGIDFSSDNRHYLFDTAVGENNSRMSLYKDGRGFLRYQVFDQFGRLRTLSSNIKNWEARETHHVAVSWKINTIEMQDEMHLFVDGTEVSNTHRFKSFLNASTVGSLYMDEASEILASSVVSPTIGSYDLITVSGSNIVTSASSDFSNVAIGSRFLILDSTPDGISTQALPYVYFQSVIGINQLSLEVGPAGSAVPFNLISSLSNVKFSVNPITALTNVNLNNEKVKVFTTDGVEEVELLSPITNTPDYAIGRDGYQDYITIYNGLSISDTAVLRTYGLENARCTQFIYIWPDRKTNIIRTILPAPTSVSKVNITAIIVKRTSIEQGLFFLVATPVGSQIVPVLVSSLEFCQPSNDVTGRRLTAKIYGENIDFSAINQVVISGYTPGNISESEILTFSYSGQEIITSKYFISLDDVIASFTPIDPTKDAGVFEIRETLPINRQENNGNYANVYLSVQEQSHITGLVASGTSILTDAYARFGVEDIGKTINVISPPAIAGVYKITNVPLDPSNTVMDSNSAVLNTTWSGSYSGVKWVMLNTSYGDSGFANGLITLEVANSGGTPHLLRPCWYEVDIPSNLIIPWETTPEWFFIGSDYHGLQQANAVIDEMRILNEMTLDTGRGESTPSSGSSITTSALSVREFEDTTQTLALYHFNGDLKNSASFATSFEKEFKQSSNSVNSNFGESIVFNEKKSLKIDNKSVFQNDSGTIEFWLSPILDTYNDPTDRYYVDLTPEKITDAPVAGLTVILPVRARSVSKVSVLNGETNYFIGGSLAPDGQTIRLGQPVPADTQTVSVTFVPIASQGDRFSVYKNRVGQLIFIITASGVDYQISKPIFWKKNTWHRVFVGWDLNNKDNQDRMILITDGNEGGIIRYGTGLKYGSGLLYGQPSIWGSAQAGTTASRNILSDINMLDKFNTIHLGADFTGQYTALARMDNIRISSELRNITYLGGEGPGRLLARDLLYTSNTNAAQPVIEDAITRLLLDFDTDRASVDYIITARDNVVGIFDFYVNVIDTFSLADTDLVHDLITQLINRLKPAHTRAFVEFTK